MIGFVHIAKTAGTSVKFILRNSLGLGHCNLMTLDGSGTGTDADLAFAKKVYPGLRSISGHTLVHPTQTLSEPIRYYTFLRDPLQRCASHYQQYVRRREALGERADFEEYIAREQNWNRQVRKIAGAPDVQRARQELAEHYFFVGLVEQFADSISAFGQLCPYPLDLRYPRLHVASDKTEKRRVLEDEGCRKLLVQANELDLELYAHARDELLPAFLAAAEIDDSTPRSEQLPGLGIAARFRMNRMYTAVVYRSLIKLQRKRRARVAAAQA